MKILKFNLSLFLICLFFATCKKDAAMPTVTDIDGNVYHTVKIGTQTWMVENLKTTHYRNGDGIDNLIDNMAWASTTKGAYADNPMVPNYAKTYGHLYNWFAVKDPRNIAPIGWHVASDTEWIALTDFLGGENVASNKLREAGISHWASPNAGATNSTRFTALPGGYRADDGTYEMDGTFGSYWTTDEFSSTIGLERDFLVSDPTVTESPYHKIGGNSVRCIKD